MNKKISEKNKKYIDKIYSDINSLKDFIEFRFIMINEEYLKYLEIIEKIKDIYNNIIPNIKTTIYNSIINDWKEILTKMPKIILAEIEEKSTKKTLFKNNIGAFGYGFNIQSNLNNLFINITIDLSYSEYKLNPIKYSFTIPLPFFNSYIIVVLLLYPFPSHSFP